MQLAPKGKKAWLLLPLRVMVALAAIAALFVAAAFLLTVMPGQSFTGTRPPLNTAQRARQERMRRDVDALAGQIGERSLRVPAQLRAASDWVAAELRAAGWRVSPISLQCRGETVHNWVAERAGTTNPKEIVVLGAHYDSVERSAGADDNASGVSVLLEVARALGNRPLARTVRLVAFVNEEPPWFRGPMMGSRVVAQQFAKQQDLITDVFVLDAVGYFCDDNCQRYPPLLDRFFPERGDFIAFVGRASDWLRVRDAVGRFRSVATVASEGLAAPRWVPGIDYSDHAEFWNVGYPGVLITDSPTYRNEHYHRQSDTAATLDWDRLTRVADGVIHVVAAMANE